MDTLSGVLNAYTSISIIGMGKNAGKTTVLNRLISLHGGKQPPLGLTSIGRDGEATDVVTGTPKPGIWVQAGTLVATAADMLRLGDVTKEILQTTGIHTPLGEVVLFRALSDGYVQLAGPSMGEQMQVVVAMLRGHGAGTVLVDGAISRKSLAAPAITEATILCSGASYSPNMQTVIRDTAYTCSLLTLPVSAGVHERRHVLEGAATEASLKKYNLQKGDEVMVLDASRILLPEQAFLRMQAQGITFTVQQPCALCCVCINPYATNGPGFDGALFLREMAAAVPVPVINVQEETA